LGKRYLTIQPANTPKSSSGVVGQSRVGQNSEEPPPKDCKTLFVNNLPYGATEEEIAKVFEKYGNIAEDGVRISRNSVTRQSKGFCYVDFVSPEDAQKVVQACTKKNLTVGGRIVRIDYDTGRIKGSYRAESGRLWTKERTEKKQQQME
jgi:RNA recognition motif-containing protein